MKRLTAQSACKQIDFKPRDRHPAPKCPVRYCLYSFCLRRPHRAQYRRRFGTHENTQREKLKEHAVAALVVNVFKVVAEKIRSEFPGVDICAVMADVEALLNKSIAAGGYVMPPVPNDPSRYIDLSQIDFEALRAQFEKGRKPVEVQKLRAKIAMKLAFMVKLNRTRIDFLEEFQKMIDEYNAGSSNVETFFAKLTTFTRKLNEEEKRGIAEQLTEEELVIFDLLTKPGITLMKQETADVKKVAKSLLEKLKQEKLVLDWRKQQTTRAMVLTTVQDILDQLPRKYTPELYEQKCDLVYRHFYDSYMGQGQSVYAGI